MKAANISAYGWQGPCAADFRGFTASGLYDGTSTRYRVGRGHFLRISGGDGSNDQAIPTTVSQVGHLLPEGRRETVYSVRSRFVILGTAGYWGTTVGLAQCAGSSAVELWSVPQEAAGGIVFPTITSHATSPGAPVDSAVPGGRLVARLPVGVDVPLSYDWQAGEYLLARTVWEGWTDGSARPLWVATASVVVCTEHVA